MRDHCCVESLDVVTYDRGATDSDNDATEEAGWAVSDPEAEGDTASAGDESDAEAEGDTDTASAGDGSDAEAEDPADWASWAWFRRVVKLRLILGLPKLHDWPTPS